MLHNRGLLHARVALHALSFRVLKQRALTNLPLHINGKSVESKATHWIDVHDPATQEVVCQVDREPAGYHHLCFLIDACFVSVERAAHHAGVSRTGVAQKNGTQTAEGYLQSDAELVTNHQLLSLLALLVQKYK